MSRPIAALGATLLGALSLRLAVAQTQDSEPFGPNLPGAPAPPPPEGMGGAAPASPPPGGTEPPRSGTAPNEGDAGAAPVANGNPTEPAAPVPVFMPVYATPPPMAPDPGAERRKAAEQTVLVSRIEAGGTLAQGLDAADAPIRQGGFYLGGAYRFAEDFVLMGRWSFASGHVVERLPGNRAGEFGVPNDVDVLETRHVFDLGLGYVLHSDGPVRFFGVPFLGPRVPVLVNDVAPRWAFEAEFGARAGVMASDSFEASAMLAYAPAIAKAKGLADVWGSPLGELRFGAGTATRAGGPFFVTLGYEGNVLFLSHQKLTSHGLAVGLLYSFE